MANADVDVGHHRRMARPAESVPVDTRCTKRTLSSLGEETVQNINALAVSERSKTVPLGPAQKVVVGCHPDLAGDNARDTWLTVPSSNSAPQGSMKHQTPTSSEPSFKNR